MDSTDTRARENRSRGFYQTGLYNNERPHSSLKYLAPVAYAATFTATGYRLRNPDPLRRLPVAPPTPHGVQMLCALKTGPFLPPQSTIFMR